MATIFEIFPIWTSYLPSLIALGILCFSVLIQAVLNAPLAFLKGEQQPGMPLSGTYKDFSFRVLRTHANSVENLPVFGFAVLLAVISGVNASWVNGLAIAHVICRALFWVIYYKGIGKTAGGPRTIAYIGGWLTNIILIGIALFELIRL